jgi:hypothetical protein
LAPISRAGKQERVVAQRGVAALGLRCDHDVAEVAALAAVAGGAAHDRAGLGVADHVVDGRRQVDVLETGVEE